MANIFQPRTNYKPFEYSHITDPLIKAMWAGHWTHNEFNFKADVQDFKTKLSIEEQGVVQRSVLLISQIEIAVKSYWSNLGKLLPKPEIADMGAVFGGIEVIHSRAYSEILTILELDEQFNEMLKEPVVKNRVTYLSKYVNKIYKNDKKNILYSLVLFTLFTEATSLFSQFYAILGFNRYNNVLKDIANIIAYTSKEEDLHKEGGILLINQIKSEEPDLFDEEFKAKILEEVQEAYLSEVELVRWILKGYKNEFLSQEILTSYIQYRLNESLVKIGIEAPFEIAQETIAKFFWMEEEVLAPSNSDFFFKKRIDYQKNTKSFSASELF